MVELLERPVESTGPYEEKLWMCLVDGEPAAIELFAGDGVLCFTDPLAAMEMTPIDPNWAIGSRPISLPRAKEIARGYGDSVVYVAKTSQQPLDDHVVAYKA